MKILDLLQKTMIMGTGGGDEVNPLLEFKTRFLTIQQNNKTCFSPGTGTRGQEAFLIGTMELK